MHLKWKKIDVMKKMTMLFHHYFDVVSDDKLLLEHIHSKHIEKNEATKM
jgi:hypothetical protein